MDQPNQKESPNQPNQNASNNEILDWNQNYLPNVPVPEDYSIIVELTQRFDIDKIYANFCAQQD